MSHQPQPSPQVPALLCSRGLDRLYAALAASARHEAGYDSHEGWRDAARLICADARAGGVRIEEILICLKRAWPTMPGIDQLPRDQSARLLSRIVTLCVEEYYSQLG